MPPVAAAPVVRQPLETFIVEARIGTGKKAKYRRIGIDTRTPRKGDERIVWADAGTCDRKVLTRGEVTSLAKQWAKRSGYTLRSRKVNPYPWLVLDTDTLWPNPALCKALNELGRQLKRKLFIREGLRTRARQQQLYDAGVRRYGYPAVLNYVARPGTSRHEFGNAADVGVLARGSSTGFGTDLGNHPGARTIAARLGIVFPMSWEPWHVELAR